MILFILTFCWVLGGAISLGITYILMRVMKVMVNKFFIVNNFKILLYYIVRDRLCNSNPVKFYLWCPFCNIPCFLLQAVLDAD